MDLNVPSPELGEFADHPQTPTNAHLANGPPEAEPPPPPDEKPVIDTLAIIIRARELLTDEECAMEYARLINKRRGLSRSNPNVNGASATTETQQKPDELPFISIVNEGERSNGLTNQAARLSLMEQAQEIHFEDVQEENAEDVQEIHVEDVQEENAEDVQEIHVEDVQEENAEDVQEIHVEDVQEENAEYVQEIHVEDVQEKRAEDVQEEHAGEVQDTLQENNVEEVINVEVEQMQPLHNQKEAVVERLVTSHKAVKAKIAIKKGNNHEKIIGTHVTKKTNVRRASDLAQPSRITLARNSRVKEPSSADRKTSLSAKKEKTASGSICEICHNFFPTDELSSHQLAHYIEDGRTFRTPGRISTGSATVSHALYESSDEEDIDVNSEAEGDETFSIKKMKNKKLSLKTKSTLKKKKALKKNKTNLKKKKN